MNEKLVRQSIQKTIFTNLTSISNVLSVTFVGSFVDHKDLSGISDIDTIVICDHLTEDVFNSCIEAVDSINLSDHGLQEYILKINSLTYSVLISLCLQLHPQGLRLNRDLIFLLPFYNLEDDPGEEKDLYNETNEEIKTLKLRDKWITFALLKLKV